MWDLWFFDSFLLWVDHIHTRQIIIHISNRIHHVVCVSLVFLSRDFNFPKQVNNPKIIEVKQNIMHMMFDEIWIRFKMFIVSIYLMNHVNSKISNCWNNIHWTKHVQVCHTLVFIHYILYLSIFIMIRTCIFRQTRTINNILN